MNYILFLIPVIPIIYLLAKKRETVDKTVSPPPFTLPDKQKLPSDEEKKKIEFKEAPVTGIPIDIQAESILFIFCVKTGLINNTSIFSKIYPYMTVCQGYDIEKIEKKFYLAPSKKIDVDKCQVYLNKLNSKFKMTSYNDPSEAKFVCEDLIYYLSERFKIVEKRKYTKREKVVLTDSLAMNIYYFRKFYNSDVRLVCDTIVSNNNVIYPKKYFKKYNYAFFNLPKREGLLAKITPDFVEDIINSISEKIPKRIRSSLKELQPALFINYLTGSLGLSAIVFATQKAMGQEKANAILSETYGIAGAIVAGIFSFGIGAIPAYKLSKTQAKFVLSGGSPEAVKNLLNNPDINKALKQELDKLTSEITTEIPFDSISFIEEV